MGKTISEQDYKALVRASLSLFVERAFVHLNPGTRYFPNWHIELIASRLEAVLQGRCRRLIINVPPRSLKSIIASVAFVAWALGHEPTKRFICASYGQDLADKLAVDCRNVMQSAWYRDLFGARLRGARPPMSDLQTTRGGGRRGTSVGGVLTGLGGDIIILDDPLKPDEALSDAFRNAANSWIDNTVMSRLNDKATGAIIVIMQRLHLDDIVGHLRGLPGGQEWEVLSLAAIAEERQIFEYDILGARQRVVREVGDVLHADRESRELLEGLRKTYSEYTFAGQYQQSPVPRGGGMVKHAWLQDYDVAPPLDECHVLQSWDTANKESELADYSVCTTWAVKDNVRYLIHVLRKRMDYPDLKRAVASQIELFHPSLVLVEDKASGTQLIQELIAQGIGCIRRVKPAGTKAMRMNAQTAVFENGMVRLPREAPWLRDYIHELTSFPEAKYDDQVDSTSQAMEWLTINGVEPGILAWYRMQNERDRRDGLI